MRPVYLDYNATTPIHPEVAYAMLPFMNNIFGNPSSSHEYGQEARKAVDLARKSSAGIINANPYEIIFTSGGTESNNMAIIGYCIANREKGNHIISSAVEHPSVLKVLLHLKSMGFTYSLVPVDSTGKVSPDELKKHITKNTVLITIMHSNNEVGTLQPIEEIGRIAYHYGIAFHSDAAQSIGKVEVNVKKSSIDMLSVAGHKLYAPKGTGFLYVRKGIRIKKLMYGAEHEMDLRPGTENIMEIAGLGRACEIMQRDLFRNSNHLSKIRNYIYDELKDIEDHILLTDLSNSLPNTLNIAFKDISARELLSSLEGIAVSSGSACHENSEEASYVLKAMDVPSEYIMGSLRVSCGINTSQKDAEIACRILKEGTDSLRRHNHIPSSYYKGNIKLTSFSEHLGCSCKIDQGLLGKILNKYTINPEGNVLVSNDSSDDSAVYQIEQEKAIVQSVDFFTPMVDDPYIFGQIACANALSDIYAMGAVPIFALNILCFPVDRLSMDILDRVLCGAFDKAKEAGIPILGGHSIIDRGFKFGLAVSGTVNPRNILKNNTPEDGDIIAITKPIGTGIICNGIKNGLVTELEAETAMNVMSMLNDKALQIFGKFRVNACTDITGFGLTGHLHEMIRTRCLKAVIFIDRVPVLGPVFELCHNGIMSSKTIKNHDNIRECLECDDKITMQDQLILSNPETSGGLMFSFPYEYEKEIIDFAEKKNIFLKVIGKVCSSSSPVIYLTSS